MKKILFIIPSKIVGGTNSSLSSLINNLSSSFAIEVLVMSSTGDAEYEFLSTAHKSLLLDSYYSNYSNLRGVNKFISIIIKLLKRLSIILHLPFERILHKAVARKFQSEHNYDIVVGFSEGISMKLASEFSCFKKITWIHCDYDRAVPSGISELYYYEKFQTIVCVSKYTRNKFVERYPMLADKAIYIYNLLDSSRILSLSEEVIDDIRFANNVFTIISVGRIDPVKQFVRIPQIAKTLLDDGIDFCWYILGGPTNSREFLKIENEIHTLGVSANVILLGPKSNPYPYFKQSNLYVSTSISEACPMVFNEAKLLGLPIVSLDFESANEFISEEVNGFVVSLEHISEVIKQVIRNDLIYNKLRANIQSTIFNNDSTLENIIKLFI